MPTDDPTSHTPHPGPRPVSLAFPFEAARDLAEQARILADDLRRLGQHLEREVDTLVPGRCRGAFGAWFLDLRLTSTRSLQEQAGHLDDQADLAEALASVATRRIGDRDAELEQWHRHWRAWEAARAGADVG